MKQICKKYAKICYPYAIHMLNICSNMQEYDKNMHKHAIVKYAQICTNMQKTCIKYAQICNNMQGLSTLQNRQKYANYMHKYAQICNICNQGFHMASVRVSVARSRPRAKSRVVPSSKQNDEMSATVDKN